MAGGSIRVGNGQGWGERASVRRSPALSIAQSETGTLPGSQIYTEVKVTKIGLNRSSSPSLIDWFGAYAWSSV